ncbi:hypothetical protein GSI_02210 [Ganoderma sinense ZZ0214-1]|uniref:N-acetyltransferase domain-containing protein n=1 Tax=Ganoderma sinense ZZ0214-1 TaxID=1077348 RepID=A0A2G8SP09_9APHY|nr:hypothetical protein GSI_02210 [Ganoderma sinense ZZ0214-1]
MAATVRRPITLSDDELDQYAKLLAESFNYNFFGSALNKDKALQEPMMRAHMAAALVKGEGEVHVAELPDVGVVGVAVWFGPGHAYLDSDTQRNAGHNQVMEKLPVELQEWWTQFLDQYAKLTDRVLGPGVKTGGYHLQLIGVSPAHRLKGVASTLMKYAETKAHAARVPCIVETVGQRNITIYKALGYLVAGTGVCEFKFRTGVVCEVSMGKEIVVGEPRSAVDND